jgi:hypothetical protein
MQCHRLLGHRGAPSLDLRVRRRQRDPVVRIGIPYWYAGSASKTSPAAASSWDCVAITVRWLRKPC